MSDRSDEELELQTPALRRISTSDEKKKMSVHSLEETTEKVWSPLSDDM